MTPSVYLDDISVEYHKLKRVIQDCTSTEPVYSIEKHYELTLNPYSTSEQTKLVDLDLFSDTLLSEEDCDLNLGEIIGEGNFGKGITKLCFEKFDFLK